MKDEQILILVDENDNPIGHARRDECHLGEGKRHRAFETLLIDDNNNVILQRRKHKLFDALWDFTAISHPIKTTTGEQTYQEASDKTLMREMNIPPVLIKNIGGFTYFTKHGENCENEYCAVLVGKYHGVFKHNEDEVHESKKISLNSFLEDIKNNPTNYTIWAQLGASIVEENISSL